MGIKINSCIDCAHRCDEPQLEFHTRHRTIESNDVTQRSNYLKDYEIEQIRLECQEKSRELEGRQMRRRANTFKVTTHTTKRVKINLQDAIRCARHTPYNLVDRVKRNRSTERARIKTPLQYRNY